MAKRIAVPSASLPPQFYMGVPSTLRIGNGVVTQKQIRPAMPHRPAKVNPNAGRSKKHMNLEQINTNVAVIGEVYTHKNAKATARSPEWTRGDLVFVRRSVDMITSLNPAYYVKNLSSMNHYLWKHYAYEMNQTAEQILDRWNLYGVCASVQPVAASELKLSKTSSTKGRTNAALKHFVKLQVVIGGEFQHAKNVWMASSNGKQLGQADQFTTVYLLLVRRFFDEDLKENVRLSYSQRLSAVRSVGGGSGSSSSSSDSDGDSDSDNDDDDLSTNALTRKRTAASTKPKTALAAVAAATTAAATAAAPPPPPTPVMAVDTKTPPPGVPWVPPPPLPQLAPRRVRPFYWRFEPAFGTTEPSTDCYTSVEHSWTGAILEVACVNWVHNDVATWHRTEFERYIYPKQRDWLGEAELPACSLLIGIKFR